MQALTSLQAGTDAATLAVLGASAPAAWPLLLGAVAVVWASKAASLGDVGLAALLTRARGRHVPSSGRSVDVVTIAARIEQVVQHIHDTPSAQALEIGPDFDLAHLVHDGVVDEPLAKVAQGVLDHGVDPVLAARLRELEVEAARVVPSFEEQLAGLAGERERLRAQIDQAAEQVRVEQVLPMLRDAARVRRETQEAAISAHFEAFAGGMRARKIKAWTRVDAGADPCAFCQSWIAAGPTDVDPSRMARHSNDLCIPYPIEET